MNKPRTIIISIVIALVVLGGEAGANDDADYPWLPATRALIASAVEAGVLLGGLKVRILPFSVPGRRQTLESRAGL